MKFGAILAMLVRSLGLRQDYAAALIASSGGAVNVTYPDALALVASGAHITRDAWANPKQFVVMDGPPADAVLADPTMTVTPWIPADLDVSAEDWRAL